MSTAQKFWFSACGLVFLACWLLFMQSPNIGFWLIPKDATGLGQLFVIIGVGGAGMLGMGAVMLMLSMYALSVWFLEAMR